MKLMRKFAGTALLALVLGAPLAATEAPKVAVINFKRCVEESKLGKTEIEQFNELTQRILSAMQEKDKELKEIAQKWNDEDYRDSLSPEAEEELSQKGQALQKELMEMDRRSDEIRNQAQVKVVQKIADNVKESAKAIAVSKNIDIILNEETCFYVSGSYDITTDVIAEMDQGNAETAKTAEKTTATDKASEG